VSIRDTNPRSRHMELLQATLDEEGGANKKLTEISGLVNRAALSIDDGQYIAAA